MLERLLKALRSAPPRQRPVPPDTSVEVARGLVLGGQAAAARGVLEQRLAAQPDDADALALLGWVLYDQGDSAAARARLDRALHLRPHHVEALNALGALESDNPDPEASIGWYRAALRADPGNAGAQYNLAQRLFFKGEYAEGFRLFAARHRLHHGRDNPLHPLPCWQGEALDGKTAFVWCDWGGLGDHLMFARYIEAFRERARPARLIVGAQAACARLFSNLPGVDQVTEPGVVPGVDVHCPLLDLPGHFGVGQDAVPARLQQLPLFPYLRPPANLVPVWRQRLDALGLSAGAAAIGIVMGNDQRGPSAAHDRARLDKQVPAAAFSALAGVAAVFVNLMPGMRNEDMAATGLQMVDSMADVADFADTAAIIDALDVVVSADTSVAHLAGAMGKPVILLLRHASGMFWPRAGEATAWYPSMCVLRQDADGDWGPALAAAGARLSLRYSR